MDARSGARAVRGRSGEGLGEGMAEDIIRRALGESAATVVPLKARKVQLARTLRRALGERRPLPALPYRVTLRDGRCFKLLQGSGSARAEIAALAAVHPLAAALPGMPRLLAHDDERLLLEWAVGPAPRAGDPAFAAALGRAFARLHGIEPDWLDRAVLVARLDPVVDRLEAVGAIDAAGARHFRGWFARLPARIRTALSYADLKEDNLCWGADGELVLFDLGSFRRHAITDEHLFGGKLSGERLWARLDAERFRAAYLATPGGYPELFEHRGWLEPLGVLRVAASALDRHDALPAWFWRQRAAYRRSTRERARAVLQAISASAP